MISGIALLSALNLAANPSPPLPTELVPATATLIASLRRAPPADTVYAEVRFLHMLRRPMLLRGQLHYGGAGQLGKRVEVPYRETTTISGSEVSVQREGKVERKFSLERAPELGALLGGFSALLGGDAAALNRDFVVVAMQHNADWRLTLTPRSPVLAKQLKSMTVDGRANEPRCFTLDETDGDASTMLLGELAQSALGEPPTRAAVTKLCSGDTR
ncbi:LolA-related protein [Rudaea sp.]|uniref:LolA-related protein n=1 Tax=Rudaea sp. TaxID=2136325 RepID=UPI0037852A30